MQMRMAAVSWSTAKAAVAGRVSKAAVAGLVLGMALPAAAAPLQVWLAGVGPGGHLAGMEDYAATFTPNAAWARAAAVTNVFKVSTNFLAHAPDQTLADMIQGLRQRHIALAMEGLMLVPSPECGRGVEGYTGPQAFANITRRLRALGGTIAYLAMDEPVYFGHSKVAANTCNAPLDALVAQIAPKIALLRAAFPGIVVGDIEPLTDETDNSLDTLLTFAQDFRCATGLPLSFIHADIGFHAQYGRQLHAWQVALHAAGLRLGVICHGDGNLDSDQEWARQAIARFHDVADAPALRPDDVIFQSWMTRPQAMLPDDRFGTMTSIVAGAIKAP